MTIEKTKTLVSTTSQVNANRLLDAGWTLLLVSDRREGQHQWVTYLFGWQEDGEPREITFTGVEESPAPF